jgi:large subunit ribosomal protein L30
MPNLRITYKKSAIGYSQRQKDTIRSLGLRKLGQTVELPDNGAIRGMVRHVRHLVVVEEQDIARETVSAASVGAASSEG